VEHLTVEKEDRGEGLSLGGGRDIPVDGELREELVDLFGSHSRGVGLVVEADVAADPLNVRLLGSDRVVTNPNGVAQLVEKARRSSLFVHAPEAPSGQCGCQARHARAKGRVK